MYFWSFVVALLVFALGALVSIYEGIGQLREPEVVRSPLINYVVLGFSVLFEGASSWVAFKAFRARKRDMGYFEAFRCSKDAITITELIENGAALLGLLIAACGLAMAQWLKIPQLDGIASIAIGVLLALAALLLARERKALLIGESAGSAVDAAICRITGEDEAIRSANGVFTVQLGPDHIVASLSAEFEDKLTTGQVEDSIRCIESKIRENHPQVSALFVKPQTPETWRRQLRRAANVSSPEQTD